MGIQISKINFKIKTIHFEVIVDHLQKIFSTVSPRPQIMSKIHKMALVKEWKIPLWLFSPDTSWSSGWAGLGRWWKRRKRPCRGGTERPSRRWRTPSGAASTCRGWSTTLRRLRRSPWSFKFIKKLKRFI